MREVRVVLRPKNALVDLFLSVTAMTLCTFYVACILSGGALWIALLAVPLAPAVAVIGMAILMRLNQQLGRLISAALIGALAIEVLNWSPWTILPVVMVTLGVGALHGNSPELVYLDPLPEEDFSSVVGAFVGGAVAGALGLGMWGGRILGDLGSELGNSLGTGTEEVEPVILVSDFDEPISRFWIAAFLGLPLALIVLLIARAGWLSIGGAVVWIVPGILLAASCIGALKIPGVVPVVSENGEALEDLTDSIELGELVSVWVFLALTAMVVLPRAILMHLA